MKPFYQKASIAGIVLFLIGIFAVAYLQYTATQRMVETLKMSQPAQIEKVQEVSSPGFIATAITLAFGLVTILLLISQQKTARALYASGYAEAKREVARQDADAQQEAQWLQHRLSQITSVLQEHRLAAKSPWEAVVSQLAQELEAAQVALYVARHQDDKRYLQFVAGYAFSVPESQMLRYEFGEGLIGQVAKEGKLVNIRNVPQGYITILSGLGKASPNALLLIPILQDQAVKGILEIASFKEFTEQDEKYLSEAGRLLSEEFTTVASDAVVADAG